MFPLPHKTTLKDIPSAIVPLSIRSEDQFAYVCMGKKYVPLKASVVIVPTGKEDSKSRTGICKK